MAEDLSETIADAAQNPRKAVVDGVDIEQHPLPDLIKAAQYDAAKKAAKRSSLGLRFTRLTPPGAV